jgi:hypothetical protein
MFLRPLKDGFILEAPHGSVRVYNVQGGKNQPDKQKM